MSLSPEQAAFLRTHLGFDDAGFLAKKRMSSQIQEFWRRREKTEEALRVLPPNHPQVDQLRNLVAQATTKAEGGNIRGAYRDLNQVKIDAKAAADTEKRGITAGKIRDQLAPLMRESARLQNFRAGIAPRLKKRADELTDEVKQLPKVSDATTRDEMRQRLDFNADHLGQIKQDWAALEASVENDIATYANMLAQAPDWTFQLKVINHNLDLLRREKPDGFDNTVAMDAMTLTQRVKDNDLTGNGAADRSQTETQLRDATLAFEAEIKTVSKLPDLNSDEQFFTYDDGTPMTPQDSDQAKLDLQERFGRFEAQERERLEKAKAEWLHAQQQDLVLNATDHRASPRVELGTFDTAEFLDDALQAADLANLAPAVLQNLIHGPMTQHVQDLIRQNPEGDELFDLGVRRPEEWKAEVARSLGYSTDLSTLTDLEKEQVEAGAQTMREIVAQNFPNKMTSSRQPDGVDAGGTQRYKYQIDEVTVGGVRYDEVTELASGGGGTVYKCKAASGEEIVLKAPLRFSGNTGEQMDYVWDDLANEARQHRMATGGEDQDCPSNVLDMKGLVMTPEGLPLIAMDLADGGDAEAFNSSVQAAESCGVLSPEAAAAMNKDAFRQMVMGVRAMQQNNMTHHDLKDANVFMTKDGTFKVADFGLARSNEGRDSAVTDLSPDQLSPGMQAAEIQGVGDITQKADNFTLGVMLENMTNPVRAQEVGGQGMIQTPTKRGTTDNQGNAVAVSALDRLRNAMLDPDPDKRPTLESVAFSSYMMDPVVNYTPEDMAELRAASAEYSAAVGRELKNLTADINKAKADIQFLEASKTGQDVLMMIDYRTRAREDTQNIVDNLRQTIPQMPEGDPKRFAGYRLEDNEKALQTLDAELQALQAKVGAQKTSKEVQEIDRQIEALRTTIRDKQGEIDQINGRPAVAPLVQRLQAAGKPFEARG